MENAEQILHDTFGYSDFRSPQREVIHRLVVENENALALLPTGGGKSLCFQIPALCLQGLTLVISPLLSLMKDQVDTLRSKGVSAANLDSTLDASQSWEVKTSIRDGTLKLLYVAPERLNNEAFVEMMRSVKISLLAVDEAHCITQWGASFRPEYLKVARFAKELEVERVLCLTATATPEIASDICKSFDIVPHKGIFRNPIYRPNLAFLVTTARTEEDKMQRIIPFLKSRTGPAIVYVTLQKQAEDVASRLASAGIAASFYHAGVDSATRGIIQNNFMESEDGVVVATIAFGMGIDKANIRQVVHYNMPKTLENFSQEVGRAGRDGLDSSCLMILSAPDVPVLEGFARGDTVSKLSLEQWVEEVATAEPTEDGTIDFYLYEQANTYDIKLSILGILYAFLELNHGFIRAVTPLYAVYDLSPKSNGVAQMTSDKSPEATIIRKYWRSKRNSYEIDVVAAALSAKVPRADLVRKISRWELDGWIQARGSIIRQRYQVLKPMPKDRKGLEELAEQMFQSMSRREEDAVAKLNEVLAFATEYECLAVSLSQHFGDGNEIPGDECGKCSYCIERKPVEFKAGYTSMIPSSLLDTILKEVPTRDDPRLLSRFAFGINSPRLTKLRLTKSPHFGCLCFVDFQELMKVFEDICEKAAYQTVVMDAPTVSKKRTYTSAFNETSSAPAKRAPAKSASTGKYSRKR